MKNLYVKLALACAVGAIAGYYYAKKKATV